MQDDVMYVVQKTLSYNKRTFRDKTKTFVPIVLTNEWIVLLFLFDILAINTIDDYLGIPPFYPSEFGVCFNIIKFIEAFVFNLTFFHANLICWEMSVELTYVCLEQAQIIYRHHLWVDVRSSKKN